MTEKETLWKDEREREGESLDTFGVCVDHVVHRLHSWPWLQISFFSSFSYIFYLQLRSVYPTNHATMKVGKQPLELTANLLLCLAWIWLFIFLIHKSLKFLSGSCFVLLYGVVEALVNIKTCLHDPHGVLNNWDGDSVDPCSWAMITCSPENLVTGLWVLRCFLFLCY